MTSTEPGAERAPGPAPRRVGTGLPAGKTGAFAADAVSVQQRLLEPAVAEQLMAVLGDEDGLLQMGTADRGLVEQRDPWLKADHSLAP